MSTTTKKRKLVRTGRVYHPYNTVTVDGKAYWDYSIKINGVVYEVSVRICDGKLFVNKDHFQGGEL